MKTEIRRTHLPYCLQRQPDGRYAILNRNYKPLGFTKDDFVDYAAHAVRLPGLRAATIAKLSFKGSTDPDAIYLYNDGCIPTASAANMKAYLTRLSYLAKLKVETT